MISGKKVEKEIDIRNEVVKLGLIRIKEKYNAPIISGVEGIYQSGDQKLHDRIIEIISTTRDVLCVSSFIIQESDIFREIVKCTERGVRVYILTSAETQISDSMDDDTLYEERKEAARELLNSLGTKALLKSGENLHSKFILSDPKSNPRAMTFTFNITIRAMNKNLEIAVELSSSAAFELYRQFIIGFWVVSKRILTSFPNKMGSLEATREHSEFADLTYIPNEIKWTVNQQTLIRDELLDMISKSENSISISSWTFDISHPIAVELIKKAKNGITVTVFTRPNPANLEFMKEIVKNNGQVYCHHLLHGKSIVVDGSLGMIMTANISKHGMDQGFETAVVLNENQVNILNQIHKEWKARVEYVSFKDRKLGEIDDRYLDLSRNLEEKNPPVARKDIDKGEIKVSNIEDYFDGNLITNQNNIDRDALVTKYVAVLIPPKLPKDAVMLKNEPERRLEVYESHKKYYVCIKEKEELEEARKIAKKFNAKIVFKDN
jgi:phosphatidylserine/phosphatidylglycerophosphate/cardiolipin synthase-like enzyme